MEGDTASQTVDDNRENGGAILSAEEVQCWSSVKEDPSDFQSWIKLLQLVEQKGKLSSIREAFERFLKLYPFCYGYWKKYADCEKKLAGEEDAAKIFQRGVEAIPLSVDLWLHYINFTMQCVKGSDTALEKTRRVFEQAISICGLEFRSDKLWNRFIDWERGQGNLPGVLGLYDRLLATPTLLYQANFERLQELVQSTDVEELLPEAELARLRAELGQEEESPVATDVIEQKDRSTGRPESTEDEEDLAPPGTAEEDVPAPLYSRPAKASDPVKAKLRERVIESRRAVHKETAAQVDKRKDFEAAIKRPYFHAKPLDKHQLQNWHNYLDFEVAEGDHRRTVFLFERCIIACAMYEEFWLKFVKYAESADPQLLLHIYERACETHCPTSVGLHLKRALCALQQGDRELARSILKKVETLQDGGILPRLHRIAAERQLGDLKEAERLFRDAVDSTEDPDTKLFFLKKFATFAAKFLKDLSMMRALMREALSQNTSNSSLYLHWLDLELGDPVGNEEGVLQCFAAMEESAMPGDMKTDFKQRKLQYLQEFGSTLEKVLGGYDEYQHVTGQAGSTVFSGKRPASDSTSSEAKKNKPDLSTSAAAVSEASQLSPAAVPQPVTGTPTSVPGGATPTMGVTDAAQAYQGQQQAYQSPQQQQEAWAAYNQYQQQQQAWAAYYSQYGQQGYGQNAAAYAQQTAAGYPQVAAGYPQQQQAWAYQNYAQGTQ